MDTPGYRRSLGTSTPRRCGRQGYSVCAAFGVRRARESAALPERGFAGSEQSGRFPISFGDLSITWRDLQRDGEVSLGRDCVWGDVTLEPSRSAKPIGSALRFVGGTELQDLTEPRIRQGRAGDVAEPSSKLRFERTRFG